MLDTVSGSSPRSIRQKNVMAALRCIHAFGAMSRAELARKLGLNRSSSGQIVAELTESGLVREVGIGRQNSHSAARTGRPGILLELIPEAANFLGVEIGVEHISAVVVDLAGRMFSHRKEVVNTSTISVQDALKMALDLAFAQLSPHQLELCQGLGLSVPAHVRADGFVMQGPIIGWRDVPMRDLVRDALPIAMPITIENDANAFALGEAYKTGASGVTLFLVMETGVGGGILIDGKLFRGGHGLAGEIGHMLVAGSPGRKLEHLIGRDSLVGAFREAEGNAKLELSDFIDAVRDRLPSAVAIAEGWAQHLAFALLQACRLIDPARIVLGGSVAPLYGLVAARVKAHMMAMENVPFSIPDISVDEDAEFGSAFGVACLMHQQFMAHDGEDREHK